MHFGSSLPAKFTEKSSGRNVTIYVSCNEVVFCDVQTHLGSFRLARFTEKVLGAFSRFLHPKTKLFAAKFRHIFDIFALHALYKMFWAHFHNICVKNEAVCHEIQTHFGSSLLASFKEKVLGAIPRFVSSTWH